MTARTRSSLPRSCGCGLGQSSRGLGFTLVELLVAIAVLAVFLGIAIPSYNEMVLGSKLRAYANELVAGAMLARSEAIKRNSVVRMCVSTDGESCITGGWEQGWLVFHDANDNGSIDVPNETVLLRHKAATSGFKINSAVASVSFQRTGVGSTAATLTVCRATPNVGGQERVVNITATGRASVSKTNAASCL